MHRRGVIIKGKGITLVISNEDMGDIIRIKKSLGKSGLLIDRVSETGKHEIKKQKVGFLGVRNLIETLDSWMLKPMLTGKGDVRAGRDTMI